MSEPKLISPMLDNFVMGDPISDHDGVRCCPAMEENSDHKYIVKIISTPASQTQLDALLLSGAYSSEEAALSYFKVLADGIVQEAQTLQKLSQLEGFVPFHSYQIVPMEGETGYDVYLLSTYRKTLAHHFRKNAMTHLGAINLGLDLCAALTVCRRSGYLYADLKPNNIYMTADQEYRIGDLGFLKLDTLKYTSLPDRYRSPYTAPEITDAYSALNTTIDVYAVGLILYQAFNDGNLPFKGVTAPAEAFPAPAYADYEMAEIILKACDPEPSMRWQDPTEMGQALVSYMQRNGVHDTPIVPVSNVDPLTADSEQKMEDIADAALTENEADAESDIDVVEDDQLITVTQESFSEEEVAEASIYSEDEDGNLTFLAGSSEDETTPNEDAADIDYGEVSDEVSGMLLQADELIAHQAPEPVIQPEPIDVPVPPPLTISDDPEPVEEAGEETKAEEASEEPAPDTDDSEEVSDEASEEASPAKKGSKRWIRNVFLVLLAVALLAAGFYYYKNYYLQPVEAILLEDGEDGVLTVLVSSPIDENKLTVICSDIYGNQLTAPVVDGKATFTGLAPNSAYTVKVAVDGFHRLTGDTSAAYTTPVQTNIVQFSAVTGYEDGSVTLSFAIDGPDANQWKITYLADNGEEKQIVFAGHTVTLTELTIGNQYTFTLQPESSLRITGTNEVTHTASKIVTAKNLVITSCANNSLTAAWSTPEGVTIDSWTVRCYNDTGFDETITTPETSAAFTITDNAASYTVEVTAVGMSVSERAYAAANSINITNFKADKTDPNTLVLSWESAGETPPGGWIILYTADGSATQELTCKSGNRVEITPVIPGCDYTFTLTAADGRGILGGLLNFKTAGAPSFENYGVSAANMEFTMCRTPSFRGWDRYDLSDSDYTTSFSVGEKASFLVRMRHEYSTSNDIIVTLFVIRDKDGTVVDASTLSSTWTDMWYRNYCELDIPGIPQTPGNYTVSVYFNGSFAGESNFSVNE